MSWIAVGVGVATVVGGAVASADASRQASNAQAAAARKYQDYLDGQQQKALGTLDSAVSPAQMASYDTALQAQSRSVARQEELAKSISPALVDSGKQLQQLINGQSAPVLDNLKGQRMQARNQLLDSLRQQYGPGAESSSAGQQALSQFDVQTSNLLSGVQQSYIQQLSNISLGGANALATGDGANKSLADIVNNNPMTLIAKDKANIISGYAAQSQAPQMMLAQSAGGDALANAQLARGVSTLGSSLIQGGAASAAKRDPTQPTPTQFQPNPDNANKSGPYVNSNGSGFNTTPAGQQAGGQFDTLGGQINPNSRGMNG